MTMNTKATLRHLSIIFALLLGLSSFSQGRKITRADTSYTNYGYLNAREIYLKVIEKGHGTPDLYAKVGNSYYFNAKYGEALKWYERYFETEDGTGSPELLLRYAQSLRANGQEKKSTLYYNRFASETGLSLTGRELTPGDLEKAIEANSGRYRIAPLEGINTENLEFGQAVCGGKLVYASNPPAGGFLRRKSAWDGMSFLDLYQVEVDSNQVVGNPKKLPGDVDQKFHESSAVFTRDGKTMYFTRSNSSPEEKGNDEKLKIYRAHLVEGKWTGIEDLSINGDDYSTAHPALDSLGSRLYFSSDRPGGYGGSDLYMASIGANGHLGKAENLGPGINTAGRETFPFVSENGILYFSSDGHFGLGGLDVFYVPIEAFGFGEVLNVGRPINSYADDFAFGIDEGTKYGFFSSNRNDKRAVADGKDENEKGKKEEKEALPFIDDNIYSLKEERPITNVYEAFIEGTVTDGNTGDPIAGATVTLYGEDGKEFASLVTDESGHYKIKTDYFKVYRLQCEKEDYDGDEKVSEAEKKSQVIDFALHRDRVPLKPGTDIAPVLNIEDILFDFDRSEITRSAALKLERLIAVLEAYPSLRIAIRSHTDSRGNDAYNMALSDRRAKSTLMYLVNHGIERDRLTAKGYGETRLLNKCSNGVPCSAEEHHKNRRSEFIVLDKK